MRTALAAALAVVEGPLEYRVAGTAAALLHGVSLPAGDIDVLVARREDVHRFAALPLLHGPLWIPESSQYFARYSVDGVCFEVSTVERSVDSDAVECVGSGPWRHFTWIDGVPVVRLELRVATELLRDRPDRYEPLLEHLRTHGYDRDLLARALTAQPISAALRNLAAHVLSDESLRSSWSA